MNDKDDASKKQRELTQKLIDAFDKLLSTGNWDKSLVLKSARKRVQALRERAQNLLKRAPGAPAQQTASRDFVTRQKETSAGFKPVYISLYQADGGNMRQWLTTVRSLIGQSVSRAVYETEDDVQALIRSKTNPNSEAYVIVNVMSDAIVPAYKGKADTDRLGNKLLSLREDAVRMRNIVQFVHNNKRYMLAEHELIPLGGTE